MTTSIKQSSASIPGILKIPKQVSLRKLCNIYLTFVALIATIASSFPYSLFSLLLLLTLVYTAVRAASPRINILLNAITIFILPAVLAAILKYVTSLSPVAASIYSAIAIIPVIYLLDLSLRQYAEQQPLPAA